MSMEDCAEKKAAFDCATQARQRTIRHLSEIVKRFERSPDTFFFSNCGGGLPAEIVLKYGSSSADASVWPTAQQIQDILVEWYNAKHAAENAWRALSEDQRRIMRAPNASYQGR